MKTQFNVWKYTINIVRNLIGIQRYWFFSVVSNLTLPKMLRKSLLCMMHNFSLVFCNVRDSSSFFHIRHVFAIYIALSYVTLATCVIVNFVLTTQIGLTIFVLVYWFVVTVTLARRKLRLSIDRKTYWYRILRHVVDFEDIYIQQAHKRISEFCGILTRMLLWPAHSTNLNLIK